MSFAIAFVLAVGVTAFLFLYLANILDKDHFFLKLALVFFMFIVLFTLPKVILDSSQDCQVLLTTENDTVTGADTAKVFGYEKLCFADTSSTPVTYLNIIFWSYRVFLLYMVCYIFYWGFKGYMRKKYE